MIGTKKKATGLFGGALRCAGLAGIAIAANAGADFTPEAPYVLNYTEVYGVDAAGGLVFDNYEVNYTDPAFTADYSYAGGGAAADAYSGSTLMGASSSFGGFTNWSTVGGITRQYFSVGADKDILFEWDHNGGLGSYNWIAGFDSAGGAYTVALGGDAIDGGPSSGSYVLTLNAGQTYLYVGKAITSVAGSNFSRISNVPAPAALPLLAGAGLMASRRRRRN